MVKQNTSKYLGVMKRLAGDKNYADFCKVHMGKVLAKSIRPKDKAYVGLVKVSHRQTFTHSKMNQQSNHTILAPTFPNSFLVKHGLHYNIQLQYAFKR